MHKAIRNISWHIETGKSDIFFNTAYVGATFKVEFLFDYVNFIFVTCVPFLMELPFCYLLDKKRWAETVTR